MKKWMTKKNGIVLVLLFIFCVGVISFQEPVYDVEITISTIEKANKGYVVQMFWDDGNGYKAENSTLTEIVDGAGTLFLSKDIVENVVEYRLDPIHGEQDITYKSIYVNAIELLVSEFWGYMSSTEQTEVFLEKSTDEQGEQLRFDVQGNDSKVYLDNAFKEYLLQASRVSHEEKVKMIIIAVMIAFVFIFYKEIWQGMQLILDKGEELSAQVIKIHPGWRTSIAVISIGLVALIAMNQYIFGDKRFLFVDASDSYYQTYPELVNVARLVEKGLCYDVINFTKSVGVAEGYIKLNLSNWVAWFGEQSVAYLMGVSHLLKIILSGWCFFGFMRLKGVERWYSVILALGYTFCGHMAVRASWGPYANEVLLVAIWLLAFEYWFQKKDIRWLPIATFLIFYHYSAGYFFVLYILFLPAYVLFRYFTERKMKMKMIGISLGVIVALGLGYLYKTNFSVIRQILNVLRTERVQDVVGRTDWSLSSFALDFDLLPRIFGRTVGLSVLGIIRNGYVEEYWNFLEDPTFYCGIIVLLLIPLAFYMMDVKKRICYVCLYLLALVYCLCEPLRTIINGFSGTTFKQSSFWIILVLLVTVSHIDVKKIKDEQKEKKCFAILSVTMMLVFGATAYLPSIMETSILELRLSLWFIVLEYIVLSVFLLRENTEYLMKNMLFLLVCIETVCVSYPVYNNRATADGSSYYDGTELALAEIESMEESSFYRIDKQYISVDSCDAIVQGYNGTAFYIGGTGIDGKIANYYNDLGLPIYSMNRRSWGISGYNDAQNLLGIKYALTKDDLVGHYGYTKVGEVAGISIYKNEYAMPMGFVYQYGIQRSTFESLNNKQRQQVLLMACLVEDGNTTLPLISAEQLAELTETEQIIEQYEISYESGANASYSFEPTTDDEMIAVQVMFEKAGSAYLNYETESGEIGTMRIQRETGYTGQVFEIAVAGVNKIWFSATAVSGIRIAKIPKEIYYANFEDNMNKLSKSAVEVTHYEENLIEGIFYTEESGMLYLPIPNTYWYVYIDGEKYARQTINDAFIGIYVEAGEHTLQAIYPEGNFWTLYKKDITKLLVCVAIFIVGSIWTYRKRGRTDERDIGSSTNI